MEIKLEAAEPMRNVVAEILKMKGFSLNEKSNIIFRENSEIVPMKNGIFVVYNSQDLNGLISFLDKISASAATEEKKKIVGKLGEKYEIIPYEKILFFEGDGNFVFCRTAENRYKLKEKLYELDDVLEKKTFIRVSKSYIVNILNVGEIVPWFGGRLLLKFADIKENIEVSRSYVRDFKDFLGL